MVNDCGLASRPMSGKIIHSLLATFISSYICDPYAVTYARVYSKCTILINHCYETAYLNGFMKKFFSQS